MNIILLSININGLDTSSNKLRGLHRFIFFLYALRVGCLTILWINLVLQLWQISRQLTTWTCGDGTRLRKQHLHMRLQIEHHLSGDVRRVTWADRPIVARVRGESDRDRIWSNRKEIVGNFKHQKIRTTVNDVLPRQLI